MRLNLKALTIAAAVVGFVFGWLYNLISGAKSNAVQ
jgi:hypothetical protein